MFRMRILVVDDDAPSVKMISFLLREEGYQVSSSDNGLAALESIEREPPDLVILDVMMPHLDGFEVCRILRKEMNVPILMLTARDDEIDRVLGLEMGADDYLTKPFSMREFLARVKALLRRVRLIREEMDAEAQTSKEILLFGNLTLDISRREVLSDHHPLALKPKEFDLLLYLARHRGQVLSREQILESVWGWTYGGGSRTVDVHIRWLRKKIEHDPTRPVRIVTVRSAGYRFEG